MENEIKTYKTTNEKTQSRAFQAFGPWLCIAESKTRLKDEEGNWLNEWQVTEEWQFNSEGWSKEIFQSGMEDERSPIEKRLLKRKIFSLPIYDYPRGVKYRQFINEHGTHMTEVVCLKTGWSIKSNMLSLGSVADDDLDKLVNELKRSIPKE